MKKKQIDQNQIEQTDDELSVENTVLPPKKAGFFDWFRQRAANKKQANAQQSTPVEKPDKKEKERKKATELLKDIESQISGIDEQNKILMYHIALMRENNDALLEQISVLKKNNEILIEQFEANIKKTKLTRLLNFVYTILAIAFVVWRMVMIIIEAYV